MVNIAKVGRAIAKAADSLEDARIISDVPSVTPTAKPLFREAITAEQRAFMPDEGQRVAEFYSPTEEFLKDLPIPTKGIRGADILKAIEKEPTIRRQEVEAFELGVDPQRRYTTEEVRQFSTRNPYRVEAQRPTEMDYTGRYTYQDTQRLELKPNEVQDISYDETIIRAIPAENKAGFVAEKGTHHTPDTIAHVRSSVKNVPSISNSDIYLIEEIQSDLVSRGSKPVRGEAKYNEVFEKAAKDTVDGIKETFKDLPSSTEIEANTNFLTAFYKYVTSRAVPEEEVFRKNLSMDKPEFKNFRNLMVEKYDGVDTFDLAVSYLVKRNIPRNTAIKVMKKIINAAMEFAYTSADDLTKAVGPAPIKDINEVARLGLQTAIADAMRNGQTKLVIPNLEQIVAAGRARPGSTQWDNMTQKGSSFHRMYVTGMQKAIEQIKKDLPELTVDTKVEFPFVPRAYYVPYLKDPIELDNTVTILDFTAYAGKNLSRLRFAEGGLTMDEQMNVFEQGGLMQEGGMMDNASGNEVPVGSTRKEVRDDVPAMLSEGEFVFPADVVRYIGLEKLMDLRQHAKSGLAHMEDIGQMGNAADVEEDLPFGMDDIIITMDKGEPVEMAEGGYLPSFMTSRKGDTPIGAPSADDASFVPTLTYETYMNAKGQSTIIPHFGGKPIYAPPVGYTLVSGTGEAADTTTAPVATDSIEATQPVTRGGGGGNRAEAMLANMPQREAIDYTKLTDEELADALSKNRTAAGIATGLSFVAGPVGLLMKFATGMEKRNILKEYERRGLEAPQVTEGFLSNLFDNVKNLFGFGDKEEAAAPAPTRSTGTGGGTTPPAEIDTATVTKGINLAGAPTTQRFSDTQLSFGADDISSTIGTEFGPIGSTQTLYDAMVNDVMGRDVYAEEGPGIALGLTPTPKPVTTTYPERDSRVPEPILPPKPVTVADPEKYPARTSTYSNVVDPPFEILTLENRKDIPTENAFDKRAAAQARLEALRAKQQAQAAEAAKTAAKNALDVANEAYRKGATGTQVEQIIDEGKRIKNVLDARASGASVGFSKGGLAAPKKKK